MTIFSEAAHSADLRDKERIERAQKGKGVNERLIRRQKNTQFHDRLVRACLLDQKRDQEITTALRAAIVACPELLLDRAYALGWGESRHQRDAEGGPPPLFEEYQKEFHKDEFLFAGSDAIGSGIGPGAPIRTVLLCHGLSPTPDTILLLADIGRAARVSHALRLTDMRVLLADVSWSRFNRAARKHFRSEGDYLDRLRISQDKRLRLYQALKLTCDIFSISAFQPIPKGISEINLRSASTLHRDLAAALWGKRALEPHDIEIKALIGQSFNGLSPHNQSLLPPEMQALVRFEKFANNIESSLRGELSILRSLSEGFSSFDAEVFIYYFAQFYAQDEYKEFLKLGVISETKFDSYFDKNYDHFKRFAEQEIPKKATMPSNRRNARKTLSRRYIYFPQYRLADLQILPYSSLSLDVARDDGTFEEAASRLILLSDCGEKKRDMHVKKIGSVLAMTPIAARNRLMSDLLSFTHFLVTRTDAEGQPKSLLAEAVLGFGPEVAGDILSEQRHLGDYPRVFSDWLTAIDNEDSVLPFHLEPYTWDQERWAAELMEKSANFIFELLMSIRRVCE